MHMGSKFEARFLTTNCKNANSVCPTTNDPTNDAYSPEMVNNAKVYKWTDNSVTTNAYSTSCTSNELQCAPTAECTCNCNLAGDGI
jgi:hypothetical protein